MVIIPAIDLLQGACVRLHQGDYDTAVRYPRNPVEQAEYFADLGVKRIHIVDLDAAKGQGNNRSWIRRIRQAVPCILEVGGGIRTQGDVEELLSAGVQRLVLGTVLVRNPEAVKRWVDQYGKLFLAGIDAREGIVRVSGWQEGSGLSDTDASLLAQKAGMIGIIYTNIERDGTLQGPDRERALRIAAISHLPVILSGGVSSVDDIHRAAEDSIDLSLTNTGSNLSGPYEKQKPGIVGIIVGKAYYEGKIDLQALLAKYPQPKHMLF